MSSVRLFGRFHDKDPTRLKDPAQCRFTFKVDLRIPASSAVSGALSKSEPDVVPGCDRDWHGNRRYGSILGPFSSLRLAGFTSLWRGRIVFENADKRAGRDY